MFKISTIIFIFCLILFPVVVFSEMSSTNYKIQTDSINFGGSDYGASTNYQMRETFGEEAPGVSNSASYQTHAGYRQMLAVDPIFSFTLSANACALGTLSTGSVATCSYSVTATTNAASGYTTTLAADGALRTASAADINNVSDGSVTAGSEEYGVALTGSDRAFADEQGIPTAPSTLTVASNSGAVTNSSVTATHKAAISAATAAGSYSQSVTIISTATF